MQIAYGNRPFASGACRLTPSRSCLPGSTTPAVARPRATEQHSKHLSGQAARTSRAFVMPCRFSPRPGPPASPSASEAWPRCPLCAPQMSLHQACWRPPPARGRFTAVSTRLRICSACRFRAASLILREPRHLVQTVDLVRASWLVKPGDTGFSGPGPAFCKHLRTP